MSERTIRFKPHPAPGRFGSAFDPMCRKCGYEISPNDADVQDKGVMWVDDKPYHRHCYAEVNRNEIVADLLSALREAREWIVNNYNDRLNQDALLSRIDAALKRVE